MGMLWVAVFLSNLSLLQRKNHQKNSQMETIFHQFLEKNVERTD